MKKRLTYIIVLLLITTGVWYFFIKEYDYLITFKTTNAPGVVYTKLVHWNQGKQADQNYKILDKKSFSKVELELYEDDFTTFMKWEFFAISDTVTKIKVHFKDQKHSFSERLKLLFGQSQFVENSTSIAKTIRTELMAHTLKYKVNVPELATIPERYCACTKTDSVTMFMKANNMMRENQKLSHFLTRNGLTVTDFPLLQITRWDQYKEEIDFEFCFPVPQDKEEFLPIEGVYIKSFPTKKALKTIFNGNYLISDRAWYSTIDHAQRNQIDIDPNPIEFYYNDPHSGTDEMTWKTEIFFPITNENKSKKAAYHD